MTIGLHSMRMLTGGAAGEKLRDGSMRSEPPMTKVERMQKG